MTAMMPVFSLAVERVLLTIAGVALIVHAIFKRYEPHCLAIHALLLLFTPCLLATLLFGHFTATKAVLVAISMFWSTLMCSIGLYRLSPWHPLAQYPGPFLLKISKLRMAWISRRGRRHIYTQQLHREYGDVVRVGPNEVSINNAAAIHALMGTSGLHKGPQWQARTATQTVQPLIAITDPKEHLRRRKPWSRALNVTSLKDFEPFVMFRAEQLVSRLAASQSMSSVAPTNLAKWFSWFAYDLMSDMAFGGGSEMLLNGDEGSVWSLLEVGLVNSDTFGHLPWMTDYIRTVPGLGSKMKEMRKFCVQRTLDRVKLGHHSRKDLFYFLNNEDGVEIPRPLPEVVADGTLAIVAGSDTTSSVLSSIFYCLLTHPEAYSRLRAEVDYYYPPGEDALDIKHHADMPYLNAVINEAMRLFPPLSDGSQRVVPVGSGGKALGDIYLPEGTITTVHMYSIHRDSRNFAPLPDSFWPERWIHAAADNKNAIDNLKLVHNSSAFFPFSYGPSNCAGKGLAMQELRMVVSGIIQRIDLSLDKRFDPVAYENELFDYLILSRPPLPVLVSKRATFQY